MKKQMKKIEKTEKAEKVTKKITTTKAEHYILIKMAMLFFVFFVYGRAFIFIIFIILIAFIIIILNAIIYGLMMPPAIEAGISLLWLPFKMMREGVYLEPIASCILSLGLLSSMIYLYLGKLYRFMGIQLLYFLLAILVASSITVMLYGFLFRGLTYFIPWPNQILTAIRMSNHFRDGDFVFSFIVGFGLVFFVYGLYLIKEFSHLGQVLGKARFANGLEIYRAGLFSSQGFVIGNSPYGKLRYAGYEPMIFVSGTGGGKSTAVVIPNLFELTNENIVVTDIKGEIYAKTALFRRVLGQKVLRFEPENPKTHRYNPLSLVKKETIDEDLDIIFKTIIPDSQDSIWADGSRSIAKMLAMYEILEKNETPTLTHIYQIICHPEFDDHINSLYPMIKTSRIANLFGKYLSAKDKTKRDLLLSAQEYLSKFDSPNLAYATSGNDFNFNEFRHKPMTIYLIMPANTETYGTICAIFFEQMIRLCTQTNSSNQTEYPINAMIDEFANLPKIPSIAKGISYLRSYRIRICAFVQQISQLKEVYGEDKKESFMAAPIKVAFNVTSYNDAKYFSALAGKKTIKINNETLHQDMSMNVSTQRQYRELLNPEEVMHLKKQQMLIYVTGFNVIQGKKNFWFKDKYYQSLVNTV